MNKSPIKNPGLQILKNTLEKCTTLLGCHINTVIAVMDFNHIFSVNVIIVHDNHIVICITVHASHTIG